MEKAHSYTLSQRFPSPSYNHKESIPTISPPPLSYCTSTASGRRVSSV